MPEQGAEHDPEQFRNTSTVPASPTAQQRAATQLDTWTRTGRPITGPDLAAALQISDSYARRLIRDHEPATAPISAAADVEPPLRAIA